MSFTELQFSLEENEAVAMDALYTSSKSFKKQIEVLTSFEEETIKDIHLYYINSLISELYNKQQYEDIEKYLKEIVKHNLLYVCFVFVKVLAKVQHNIVSYHTFKKEVIKLSLDKGIDYETFLKGFV